jgi:hypothetical protein
MTRGEREQATVKRAHVRRQRLEQSSERMMPCGGIQRPHPTWLAETGQTDNRAVIRQMREAQKCHGSTVTIQSVEKQRSD